MAILIQLKESLALFLKIISGQFLETFLLSLIRIKNQELKKRKTMFCFRGPNSK